MRFGELAWLTWEDIDLTANVLHIQAKDGWKPKTGDQRAVPLNAAIKRLLKSLPKRWRWVVTMPPSARCPWPGRQWSERRLLAALKRDDAQQMQGVGMFGLALKDLLIKLLRFCNAPGLMVSDCCKHQFV